MANRVLVVDDEKLIVKGFLKSKLKLRKKEEPYE